MYISELILCSTIQEYYCRGFQLVLTDLKVLFRIPAHEDDDNDNDNDNDNDTDNNNKQ